MGELSRLLFAQKVDAIIDRRDSRDGEALRGSTEKAERANRDKLSPSERRSQPGWQGNFWTPTGEHGKWQVSHADDKDDDDDI